MSDASEPAFAPRYGDGATVATELHAPESEPYRAFRPDAASEPDPLDGLRDASAAIDGDGLETVFAPDERVPIGVATGVPWRWICRLHIVQRNGRRYLGTGWLAAPRLVITAGHCVNVSGGWARQVSIYPGATDRSSPFGGVTVGPRQLAAFDGWATTGQRETDCGAILLPREFTLPDGFGHFRFGAFDDAALRAASLRLSGYPDDRRPKGLQWTHAQRARDVTQHWLHYQIDTFEGQSGAPVWIEGQAWPTVVGLHAYGDTTRNRALRITQAGLATFELWRQRSEA